MECMSLLGVAVCSPDAELRACMPLRCSDIQRDSIPAALRRRSSQAMQLAFSAAVDVCANTGRSPAQLPVIFASVAGEIQTTDRLCTELVKPDGLISPSAFHNSVQNTAAGYWSIAHQCTQAASALAAGPDTFAMALLEAWCQLVCQGGELLLVAYDECWPDCLAPHRGRPALAVALLIAAGEVEGRIARLSRPRPQASHFPAQWADLAAAMPIASVLPLLECVGRGKAEHACIAATAAWQIGICF